jgi:desulfoferrodoxin (superoxide reductase-like protein)
LDKNFLSPLEKTHIPVINIIENKAIVEIWEISHPMIEWHSIYSISLYDEYWDLVEDKFLNPWENPKAIFEVWDLDDFEIRIKCNVDWLWSSGIVKNS